MMIIQIITLSVLNRSSAVKAVEAFRVCPVNTYTPNVPNDTKRGTEKLVKRFTAPMVLDLSM